MTKSEKLAVEWLEIEKVIPYARNPRKHGKGIEKVAASIKEFGFRQPIVVDKEMVVIVGHARLQASQHLGLKKVPVHIAQEMSEAQAKAYRLADNRTNEEAIWDEELLALELHDLEQSGANLDLTAFDVAELDAYLAAAQPEKGDPEAVPPKPENPVSKPMDVWQLGDHRLVCGDSSDPRCYSALLGSGKADMVFTDPPYNVAYQGKAGKIQNDDISNEAFLRLLQKVFANLYDRLKAGGPIYVSYSDKESENFHRALREAGVKFSAVLVWVKNQMVLGRGDYQYQHEPIFYGWKPGGRHVWHGGRKNTTISKAGDILPLTRMDDGSWMLNWSDLNIIIRGENLEVEAVESSIINAEKPLRSELHPTMKPVELLEKFIRNSSARGDIVLDAFGGSGSTLIACENLHRSARLIELEPSFCDVIVQRWQDYSGREAVHAETGKPFGKSE